MRISKSWLNPRMEVRSSKIHRKGIFAKDYVQKGERVAIIGGDIMLIDEINNLLPHLQHYPMQIEERFVIGPRRARQPDPVDFFNHSCNPNCGFKGQIFLVAMRDICKDEEVVFDYAMTISPSVGSDIVFRMRCRCRTANCRESITEDDWKLPGLITKYTGYYSQYIQDKIDKMTCKKRLPSCCL
jgi:uncharacterized protein